MDIDPYNPVEVHASRRAADSRALHIFGRFAKELGYTVTVRKTPSGKTFGIYLVRKT